MHIAGLEGIRVLDYSVNFSYFTQSTGQLITEVNLTCLDVSRFHTMRKERPYNIKTTKSKWPVMRQLRVSSSLAFAAPEEQLVEDGVLSWLLSSAEAHYVAG